MKIKLGMLCLLMCVFVGAMKEEDSDQKKQLNEELASRVNAQWKKAEEKQLKEELQLMVPIHAEGAVEPDFLDIRQNEMRWNAVLKNRSKKGAPSQTIVITSTEGQVQGSDAGKKVAYEFIYNYSAKDSNNDSNNEYIYDKNNSNDGFIISQKEKVWKLRTVRPLSLGNHSWKEGGLINVSVFENQKNYGMIPVNEWICKRDFMDLNKKVIDCENLKTGHSFSIECDRKAIEQIIGQSNNRVEEIADKLLDQSFLITGLSGYQCYFKSKEVDVITLNHSFFIKNSKAEGKGIIDFCTDGKNIFMLTDKSEILHYIIVFDNKKCLLRLGSLENSNRRHQEKITAIAYSSGYDDLVVGFADGSLKALHVRYTTEAEKYGKTFLSIPCDKRLEKPLYDIVFNRDESYILLASTGTYAIYQIKTLSGNEKKTILKDQPKKQPWTWKNILGSGLIAGGAYIFANGVYALYKYLTVPKTVTLQEEE